MSNQSTIPSAGGDSQALLDSQDPHILAELFLAILNIRAEGAMAVRNPISEPQAEMSAAECNAALASVPDHGIFPPMPDKPKLTIYSDDNAASNGGLYIKRPCMFDDSGEECDSIAQFFLNEAMALNDLACKPHPNIIRFHGVLVTRGRITGLVLQKHQHNLRQHLEQRLPIADPIAFMRALTNAVFDMHSLGIAHNDINPTNIIVSDEGMPVLTNFGLAAPFGVRLPSGGPDHVLREGWKRIYSNKEHDFDALRTVLRWFRNHLS